MTGSRPSRTAKPGDWKTLALPLKRTKIRLGRGFTASEVERIRKGLVPDQMEDKWFIYWKDDALYFHRSWTGFCIYVVRFAAQGDGWTMVEADVNRDPEQYSQPDEDTDASTISFLIDVLLLHRDAVLPGNEPRSASSVLTTWGQIGRAMLGQHPDDDPDEQQETPPDLDKPRR